MSGDGVGGLASAGAASGFAEAAGCSTGALGGCDASGFGAGADGAAAVGGGAPPELSLAVPFAPLSCGAPGWAGGAAVMAGFDSGGLRRAAGFGRTLFL